MSRKPKSTSHYVVEDDRFDPDDETVSSEQIDHDIEEALLSSAAWLRGKKTLTVSEQIDGQWTERQESAAEFFARRAAAEEMLPADRLVFLTEFWTHDSRMATWADDHMIKELEAFHVQAINVAHSVEQESEERQAAAVKMFMEQVILPWLLRRQRPGI